MLKKITKKDIFSSSYIIFKYGRETKFQPWKFTRSGSKAEDGGKERRGKVGDKNGQATHGARKPPGPIETTCR